MLAVTAVSGAQSFAFLCSPDVVAFYAKTWPLRRLQLLIRSPRDIVTSNIPAVPHLSRSETRRQLVSTMVEVGNGHESNGWAKISGFGCVDGTCSERATLSGDASMYRQKDRWRITQNSPATQHSSKQKKEASHRVQCAAVIHLFESAYQPATKGPPTTAKKKRKRQVSNANRIRCDTLRSVLGCIRRCDLVQPARRRVLRYATGGAVHDIAPFSPPCYSPL